MYSVTYWVDNRISRLLLYKMEPSNQNVHDLSYNEASELVHSYAGLTVRSNISKAFLRMCWQTTRGSKRCLEKLYNPFLHGSNITCPHIDTNDARLRCVCLHGGCLRARAALGVFVKPPRSRSSTEWNRGTRRVFNMHEGEADTHHDTTLFTVLGNSGFERKLEELALKHRDVMIRGSTRLVCSWYLQRNHALLIRGIDTETKKLQKCPRTTN